jgi:voltage-gated potassium channel
MYGATSSKETPLMDRSPPAAAAPRPLLVPSQSTDRRREFALRRQKAKRKVTTKKEEPVLQTLFAEPKTPRHHHQVSHEETPAQAAHHGLLHTHKRRHSLVYTILNPHSKQWPALLFKRFITLIILMDLLLFILSTDLNLSQHHGDFFHTTEGIASCIFLVEYVARVAVCTEKKKYHKHGRVGGRLAYMKSWAALIDLFATLPFFLEYPTGWNLPTLTYLRFFRLFRILKTEGYVRALDAVYRVVYYNREILWVAALLCIFLILVTAVLLYYLKPQNEEDAADFQSIGATLYMSTMMLTGQGGPDGANLPWYTKMVVLLTAVFSVAMFAIPASMLTWGFEAEAARMAKVTRQRTIKQQLQSQSTSLDSLPLSSSSDSDDDSSDGDSTDEEYLRIIAGEDGAGEATPPVETPFMKQLRESFLQADADADGNLTMSEFMRLQTSLPPNVTEDLTTVVQTTLENRVHSLEAMVQANNEKLDRVLELLQPTAAHAGRRRR